MPDTPGPPNAFAAAASACFDEATRNGFPAFLTPVAESSPVNATPYLTSYADFRAAAAKWPGRGGLVARLEQVRAESERHNVIIDAMLIGGSFTELAKPAPGDVDCLMLYRQARPGRAVEAKGLTDLQRRVKAERVDVRFLPLDSDPLALVKALCYFTILYSKDKHAVDQADVRVVRGLLLLDCRA